MNGQPSKTSKQTDDLLRYNVNKLMYCDRNSTQRINRACTHARTDDTGTHLLSSPSNAMPVSVLLLLLISVPVSVMVSTAEIGTTGAMCQIWKSGDFRTEAVAVQKLTQANKQKTAKCKFTTTDGR